MRTKFRQLFFKILFFLKFFQLFLAAASPVIAEQEESPLVSEVRRISEEEESPLAAEVRRIAEEEESPLASEVRKWKSIGDNIPQTDNEHMYTDNKPSEQVFVKFSYVYFHLSSEDT